MICKTLIPLLLGTTTLLPTSALPVSLAQSDSANESRVIACMDCSLSYLPEAALSGVEGRVTLLLDIDAEGQVTNTRLLYSSGYPILDQSALDTALTWQFQPMSTGVESVSILIEYRLDRGESSEDLED
jgi:TonB family protein